MAIGYPRINGPVLSGVENKLTDVWKRFFIDLYNLINSGNVGGWPVGTIVPYYGTASLPGWLLVQEGSIGNSVSGATVWASQGAYNLYAFYWNGASDTYAPVAGGRGSSAAADFRAGKALTMPFYNGRILASAGTGSGLTAKSLHAYEGTETHILDEDESSVQPHTHDDITQTNGSYPDGHTHVPGGAGTGTITSAKAYIGSTAASTYPYLTKAPTNTAYVSGGGADYATVTGTTDASTAYNIGSSVGAQASSAHNNMGPTVFYNALIKV